MNYTKKVVLALALFMLAACQKDEYKLDIPESGVTLSLPLEGSFLDLNDEAVSSCKFECNDVAEGGNTLVLSTSPLLKDKLPIKTVTVEMGDATSLDMDVLDADIYFSSLGIGGGKTGTLYWSIKPSKNLTVAATEIRSFTTKRIQTQLTRPEDQAEEALNVDTPDKEVTFSWQIEKEEPNTEYQLCFGMDSRMENGKIIVDAGNTGECTLTHQQLQDIIEQLPIKKYSLNNTYWNVMRKSDGSFVSRSSHILKLSDMLVFTDVRGDESITYRVARILYSTGEEVIWLAENLRATKYPDGSEIKLNADRWNPPTNVPEGHKRAYGYYYSVNNTDRFVPKGWRMPLRKDYQTLMDEARLAKGATDVFKHPIYWNWKAGPTEYANAWGLGLTASGAVRWLETPPEGYNAPAGDCSCFLLAADLVNEAIMISDYGCSVGEIYMSECWGGASARLIYVGN